MGIHSHYELTPQLASLKAIDPQDRATCKDILLAYGSILPYAGILSISKAKEFNHDYCYRKSGVDEVYRVCWSGGV
jgi:hypothetical protein